MRLETTKKRFLSKITITPNNCWEWQGARTLQGYGKFKSFGESLAHRVSFILNFGPLPEQACVLHRCDNPPCVNPAHIFLGTRDINNKDRASKGRTVTPMMNLTHCKRGHEFTKENTVIRINGTRLCRICVNEGSLKRYHRRKRGCRELRQL